VSASLNRLEGALGGDRFEGAAVAEAAGNKVKKGQFVIIGPAAYFKSDDGQTVGTAEERLGSLQPNVIAFRKSEAGEAVAEVIEKGDGRLPVDPTLGNAHVVEATEENIIEHASKGGPVMYPIVILAGAAFLVALVKFVGMIFLRKPRPRNISELLAKVAGNDTEGAREQAAQIRGPAGEMLRIGADHLGEPPELIEEVMYEKVLSTRLRVQRMLPFIAISAAAAPLLGLLGTVTGIINTFKLITVFGTGDVKTLSGGISEALITTEFGLIVAIPSLLLHAFLSRRARSIVDQMEKSAVAFMNEVSRARYRRGEWETGEGAELEDVEPRGESGDMPRTQENPEEGSNGDGRPREGAYETEATT
jgi:biopolymer transport protein ExbB